MLIKHTKAWLKEVVIGLGLCPFAFEVFSKDKIQYELVDFAEAEVFLESFRYSLDKLLDLGSEYSTTIIIIEKGLEQFEDYLAVYYILEDYLEANNLAKKIQLASFHPLYQFGGTETDDVENFTNRSPYPLIHLLKVTEVEQAISSHPDISKVPLDNIETMKTLGKKGLVELLGSIYN